MLTQVLIKHFATTTAVLLGAASLIMYLVLGAPAADGLRPVARVYEPTSGRTMVVRTDQPGVQFYTGNYLDGDVGRPDVLDGYGKHSGFCLETQHFPDSVNQPSFPPVWLRPGETYTHATEHTFGASEGAPAGAY